MIIELPQLNRVLNEVPSGVNLLTYLSQQKIPVARSCSGEGVCGTCAVLLEGDSLPEASAHELRLLKTQLRSSSKASSNFAVRMACMILIPTVSKKWVLRTHYW